jgi:hypothetical protein
MTALARSGVSPKQLARIAGALYLLLGILTGFAGMALPRLYVAGDATATAGNLTANAVTVRYAVVADLVGATVWVLLALTLYLLLGSISRGAARAMVVFAALGTGIMMLNTVFAFEGMRVATGAVDLTAVGAGGSSATALLLLDTHHYGVFIAQVFFGLWLVPLGYLVCRSSGMLPTWLGVMLMTSAGYYLADLLAAFLAPGLGSALHAIILIPPTIAEISAVVYLVAVGVRVSQPVGHLPAEA